MKPEILEELALASELEDARAVEEAIEKAYHAGFDAEFVPVLLDLLERNFHTRHEDIVSTLQELKDPRAVNGLYRAALVSHPYLDYDTSTTMKTLGWRANAPGLWPTSERLPLVRCLKRWQQMTTRSSPIMLRSGWSSGTA